MEGGASGTAAAQLVTAAASLASGTIGIPAQPPLTGVTPEDQVKKITGFRKAMTKTMT
jgi:hypothetical protein